MLVGEIAGILQDVEAGGEGVGGYWGQDDFSLLVHMDEDLLEQILGRVTAAVERHDCFRQDRSFMGGTQNFQAWHCKFSCSARHAA